MKVKKGMLVVLLASVAGLASAAEISIDPAVANFVDWNSAIWGSPAAAPTAGNDYVLDTTYAYPLTLGTYGSFAGDSFTADPGSIVANKGGGNLGGTMYLNGGQWRAYSPGESEILGNIRLLSSSSVLLIDGGMKWSTGLSSADGAVLRVIAGYSASPKAMVFNAVDHGFLGTFQVEDSETATGTYDVQFNSGYNDGVLKVLGNSGLASQAAVYQLVNDISFEDVFMPDGSGGLVDLAPGTYDASALSAAGVSSTYYNDLGGTLTVIPEPATMGLMGLAGIIALAFRRLTI